MKKVLFVATVVKTHIMQFHIPYLKMLQEMGWETAVAARNDYENPEDCRIPFCDRFFDIPFERVPWKPRNLKAYRMLKELIDIGDYDIIHCHTPVGAMLARLAARSARKKGTKVIYTAHGFHFYKGAPKRNWLLYYPMERILSRMTDVLITINQEDFALAQKVMTAKRVVYVPGVGIDLSRFRTAGGDRKQIRASLGYGEEDFLLLTVAEMIPRKNHITVLKALALLKDREEFGNMHYLICGRGALREELEAQAKEMGIAEHVNFLGYRRDTPQLYHGSDVFAFMSYQEGLPVALMEAMGCGLSAVCTKIRGNTDLVEDGISGIFADNDPKSLADAILRLYHDPQLRQTLSANAAKQAENFDEKNTVALVRDIYLSTQN